MCDTKEYYPVGGEIHSLGYNFLAEKYLKSIEKPQPSIWQYDEMCPIWRRCVKKAQAVRKGEFAMWILGTVRDRSQTSKRPGMWGMSLSRSATRCFAALSMTVLDLPIDDELSSSFEPCLRSVIIRIRNRSYKINAVVS